MLSNDFEEAFDNFLDRTEYDDAANALFDIVRAAFRAGWLAAGGQPPVPQKLFQLIRPGDPLPQTGEDAEQEKRQEEI